MTRIVLVGINALALSQRGSGGKGAGTADGPDRVAKPSA